MIDMDNLLHGYSALQSTSLLQFPSQLPFEAVHDFLLHSILLNPHFKAYPPSDQYQHIFWKWAIHHLEAMSGGEGVEIDPRIYHHYLSVLPSSSQGPAGPPAKSYVTRYWSSGSSGGIQRTTLLESRTTIESGTTGLRTWPASYRLAQFLIAHPELVAGKRVLELGAGTGFLGIIAARLQCLFGQSASSFVYMTDANEEVLQRCCQNATLPCNQLGPHTSIDFRYLNWSDALDSDRSSSLRTFLNQQADPDLVVGADLVYDPSLIPCLVAVIRMALESTGRLANQRVSLIALTVRNETTLAQFLKVANENLTVEDVQVKADEQILRVPWDGTQVRLYKMTKRPEERYSQLIR